MKKSIIILFAIILFPVLMSAQDVKSLFNKGNIYFKQKDYPKAVRFYDSILKTGYRSANVYFNLGNAYYKLGNYTQAVLNYERAKKIVGETDEIQLNIALTNLNIVDKIEPIPQLFIFQQWDNLVNSVSSRIWGTWCLIFIWLSLITLCLFIFIALIRTKNILLILFILFFLASIFTGILSYQRYQTETDTKYAIVLTPMVYLKSAPDVESTDLFIIHEGVKIQMTQNVGEWYQVKLADGKTGWLKRENFEGI